MSTSNADYVARHRAKKSADRTAIHRTRQVVDTSPANLALRLRAEVSRSPEVMAITARYWEIRTEYDRVVFDHTSVLRSYAQRSLDQVKEALQPAVSELGITVAATGDTGMIAAFNTLAHDVGVSGVTATVIIPIDTQTFEVAHGLAVICRNALKHIFILARDAGGIEMPGLNAAITLVDMIGNARRRPRAK